MDTKEPFCDHLGSDWLDARTLRLRENLEALHEELKRRQPTWYHAELIGQGVAALVSEKL